MKRTKPATSSRLEKPKTTKVKSNAKAENKSRRSGSIAKGQKKGKKTNPKEELAGSDDEYIDDANSVASKPFEDEDSEIDSLFESENQEVSDDLDELFSDKDEGRSRKNSKKPSRNASKKPVDRARSRGNKMDEEKPTKPKPKSTKDRQQDTPKSKKPKAPNSSSNKAVHRQLFNEEDSRSLKEMTGFFFSYLRDKNSKGMTVNSLVKYMKTNGIQTKDRKLEIDDELALRMIKYLVKTGEIDKRGVKTDDIYVDENELEQFICTQRRFHLTTMKRIFDK